jgi:hypothetical protein
MEEDNDPDIYITDSQLLHPEKSVPHTLSVELTGSPCSGGDRCSAEIVELPLSQLVLLDY